MSIKDETNKVYGRLTVIRQDGHNRKESAWLCRCSCGKELRVAGYSLRSGNTTSCGCYRTELVIVRTKKELAGQRFGRLLVIHEVENKHRNGVWWRVRCDCGKEFEIRGGNLTSTGVSRCKQCQLKEIHDAQITHGESRTKSYRTFLQRMRHQKQKGLDSEWLYEMEQAIRKLQPLCVICGGSKRMCTDYVYPLSKGYGLKVGNAVRLCNSCNLKKMNKLPEELQPEWRDAILSAAQNFADAWNSGFRA